MQTANTDKTLEKEEEENDSCTGRGLLSSECFAFTVSQCRC